jgi:hypothetical protein
LPGIDPKSHGKPCPWAIDPDTKRKKAIMAARIRGCRPGSCSVVFDFEARVLSIREFFIALSFTARPISAVPS